MQKQQEVQQEAALLEIFRQMSEEDRSAMLKFGRASVAENPIKQPLLRVILGGRNGG